MVYRKKGV